MKLVAVLIVALAVAPAAQAATSQVAISVPLTQVLEGSTSLLLTEAASTRAQVIVKSNVAWTLVARVSGSVSPVALRIRAGSWTPLAPVTPVLHGSKGVHTVTYEVRTQGAAQGLISLSLEPAREVSP